MSTKDASIPPGARYGRTNKAEDLKKDEKRHMRSARDAVNPIGIIFNHLNSAREGISINNA